MRYVTILVAGLMPLCAVAHVGALEADQFTVPPKPLADIGPEIDAHMIDVLGAIMAQLNVEIVFHQRQLRVTTLATKRREHQKTIAHLKDPQTLISRFVQQQTPGWPECPFEQWLRYEHKFKAQPAFWLPKFKDSIYADCAPIHPLLAIAMSPTVNVHGTLLSTDKIGHFLQQGNEYYVVYRGALSEGRSQAQALAAAVKFGVKGEKTIYGHALTGIYSNGDLAANYAGLRFLINLTEAVTIGGEPRPAICGVIEHRWVFTPNADSKDRPRQDFLSAFFTDHFDESLNPSDATNARMYPLVLKRIRQRSEAWHTHYKLAPRTAREKVLSLVKWHGEDYGHGGFKRPLTAVAVDDGPPDETAGE